MRTEYQPLFILCICSLRQFLGDYSIRVSLATDGDYYSLRVLKNATSIRYEMRPSTSHNLADQNLGLLVWDAKVLVISLFLRLSAFLRVTIDKIFRLVVRAW